MASSLSCGQTKEERGAGAKKKVPKYDLTIALSPTIDCLPYYIASQYGLFDSLRLRVKVISTPSPSDCRELIKKDKADVVYSDLLTTIPLQAKEPVYVILTGFEGRWSILSSRRSRIKKCDALFKRNIATSRYDLSDFLCDQMAKQTHKEREEFFRPQIGNIQLRYEMLQNNQVDAAVLPSPLSIEAARLGHRIIYERPLPFSIMLCTKKISSKKSNELKKLQEGYTIAFKGIKKRTYNIASVLASIYHTKEDLQDSVAKILTPPIYSIKDSTFHVANIWLKERGVLKRETIKVPQHFSSSAKCPK